MDACAESIDRSITSKIHSTVARRAQRNHSLDEAVDEGHVSSPAMSEKTGEDEDEGEEEEGEQQKLLSLDTRWSMYSSWSSSPASL